MSAGEAARLRTLLALGLVGLALSGCTDRRDVIAPTGPRRSSPSFQILPGSGTWTTGTPMPTVLSVAGLAAIGGRVYVVGTYWSGGTLTTAVEVYDPAADAWTTLAPAPAAAGEVSVGTVGGKLYLVGGCAINADCRLYTTGVLQVYDPATNTWSSGASMPTPRSGMAVGALNGKLYVAGGVPACPPCLTLAVVEVYDPGTNSWATAAPLPTDVSLAGAAVINGKFYVAGGIHLPTPWPNTSAWTTEASVAVYDPVANVWTHAAPMPQAVMQVGTAALNGILYAAGGNTLSGVVYDQFEAYNPTSDSWTQLPALPQNVSAASMAALNGTVFLAGNGASGQPMGSLLAYSVMNDQTITFGALASRTFGDPDFTVSATASSGLAVSFAAAGSCTVSGSTVHITGAGSCSITASQAGSASFNPAPSVTQSFATAKAAQTITFGALAGKTIGDADFTVSATASSGLAVGFAASWSCTVSGSTVHITGTGSCTITASQAGDANYNAAPTVTQSFTIGTITQTITFALLAGRTFGDADFAVSATASSGLTVSFSAAGSCTVSGTSVHITGAGSCTITASQAGNATYGAAANVAQSFAIARAAQAITFSALASRTFGDADFAVSAAASSGLAVAFAASGNCTISGSMVHIAGAGSCTVTASQAGDANYNAAPSVAQSFTIARATPLIAWNPPASMVYGAPLDGTQLNATATGVGSVSLTGAFSYSPRAGTVLGPGTQTLGVSFTPDDAVNYVDGAGSAQIAVLYNTAVGHVFLAPIKLPPQPASMFKLGSTIPVKFQLFLADGVTPVSTAAATIQVSSASTGAPVTVTSTVPNQGVGFRYDPVGQQYIFNLGTSNWSLGSYQVTASLDDGSRITVVVGVR